MWNLEQNFGKNDGVMIRAAGWGEGVGVCAAPEVVVVLAVVAEVAVVAERGKQRLRWCDVE